jgi:hypothetical protein
MCSAPRPASSSHALRPKPDHWNKRAVLPPVVRTESRSLAITLSAETFLSTARASGRAKPSPDAPSRFQQSATFHLAKEPRFVPVELAETLVDAPDDVLAGWRPEQRERPAKPPK